MKTLHLFRHAKADIANVRDHDRPLAKRGVKAAKLMAALMTRTGLSVDHVYCSTSRRTRETYELIAPALGGAIVAFRDELYLADTPTLLSFLHDLPAAAGAVMLIGHNPGFHDLSLNLLAPAQASQDLDHLREKFSTAGLCSVEFAAKTWRDARLGTGKLLSFIRPRDFA